MSDEMIAAIFQWDDDICKWLADVESEEVKPQVTNKKKEATI